jgi:hypothetical protein
VPRQYALAECRQDEMRRGMGSRRSILRNGEPEIGCDRRRIIKHNTFWPRIAARGRLGPHTSPQALPGWRLGCAALGPAGPADWKINGNMNSVRGATLIYEGVRMRNATGEPAD